MRGSTGDWYLVNASPDVREQLELVRDPGETALRSNPVAGVILTDAEIDHTAGLIILRESAEPLDIYGTSAVREALSTGFPVLRVLEGYSGVRWHDLEPGERTRLPEEGSAGLEIEPFAVPADPPLYMGAAGDDPPKFEENGLGVGLTFTDLETGRVAVYAPAIGNLNDALLERLRTCDVALIDGTFWRNDELTSQGVGRRTAQDMGHLPLSGPDGTLARLENAGGFRKVLVHINNSNPILLGDSPERRAVAEAGFEVGYDGMTIDI